MFRYHLLLLSCTFLSHINSTASWAEETLAQLSRAEKIGQLIAMRVEMADDVHDVIAKIERCKIGGVVPLDHHVTHSQWSVQKHTTLIEILHNLYPNNLQSPVVASLLRSASFEGQAGYIGLCAPVLIIEDAERGCSQRMPELPQFPRALTLGALYPHNTNLIYQIGYATGEQCKALGIHINCAPVVDVNSNYNNPVIGMRSFGDNADAVGHCAVAYTQGMHDAGTLACIKHFPGHGNTDTDSHFNLPIVTSSKAYIETNDIAPFIYCLQHTTPAVMIGHLAVPALETSETILPATLSSTITHQYLQQKLGFTGLIISDGLDMGALTAYGDPGDVALQALKAGIDILLCPPDVDAVIERISQALDTGEYTEAELDAHVLKILQVKELLCVRTQKEQKPTLHVYKDLIQKAYNAAATSCHNFESVRMRDEYAAVTLGSPCAAHAPFYYPASEFYYTKPLLIHLYPGSYKTHRLTDELQNTLAHIAVQYPGSIILLFGSPYCLTDIPSTLPTLVLYEDTLYTHATAEKIMTGVLVPQGKLPIAL